MISFRSLLLQHGYALLTGYVFWYQLGRRKGRSVLDLLCKLSIEPDTCVRKTEDTFSRRGPVALLFVKFLPGLSLVSVALAGVTDMPFWKFLGLNAAGSALWIGSYLTVGMIFHHEVDAIIAWLGLFGQRAGSIVVLLLALYLLAKYAQRRLRLRWLRINRISPHDVYDRLTSGDPLTILDLRNSAEVARSGVKIVGATVINTSELRYRISAVPIGRDIILYCT